MLGPDGALYIADWFNPLVGHMQHSLRDPNRDHVHGRIWRVTHKKRPLVEPAQIVGASIDQLLKTLEIATTPELRTREKARLELRERDEAEVDGCGRQVGCGSDGRRQCRLSTTCSKPCG